MPSVSAPNLAQIDAKLTEPCPEPVVLRRTMTVSQQTSAWAADRAALVGCKQRHDGLVIVIFTERKLLAPTAATTKTGARSTAGMKN